MNLHAEPVELMTIKSMRVLAKQPDLSELQLKMSALRNCWLLGDKDSNLTLKAMNLYHHAMEYRNSFSDEITKHMNGYFIEEMKENNNEEATFAPSPRTSVSKVSTRAPSIPRITTSSGFKESGFQEFSP